jgi:uncharacterized protein YrrD
VRTADGRDAGRVDRVVLDPQTKEVSHIVVRQGLLFTEDKVLPVSLIANAAEEGVALRAAAADLEALPPFEETYYIRLEEDEWRGSPTRFGPGYALPLYWYPSSIAGAAPGYLWAPPGGPDAPSRIQTERNIPQGTVAVQTGAKVISADDKHVGDVEEVLTDPEADRITGLIISQGLFLKDKKRVPAEWIHLITEEAVHLAVVSRTLERLRVYDG